MIVHLDQNKKPACGNEFFNLPLTVQREQVTCLFCLQWMLDHPRTAVEVSLADNAALREQRRWELAKELFVAGWLKAVELGAEHDREKAAKGAVLFADTLLNALEGK